MRPMTLDFIRRSFRDIADKDYLAARILYRCDLGPQFLWAALQAVEKYIKAILLFNRIPAKGLSHDVKAGLDRLAEIRDIPFDIPPDVKRFVAYLSKQGPNRYFEFPAFAHGDELLLLDCTVWHLRRYCGWLRATLKTKNGIVDLFPRELARIQAATSNPHKFRIHRGFLEDVLQNRRSRLREHLVWKNFYYGARRKHVIKRFTKHAWSANPAHFLSPAIFTELSSLVDFSKSVRKAFRSVVAQSKTGKPPSPGTAASVSSGSSQ